MNLQLNPEQAIVVNQAIQAGLIRRADDVLDVGVETIRQQLEHRSEVAHPNVAEQVTAEQWSEDFHAWVRSHATTTPLLSDEAISRDSIYGTDGL